MEEETKGNNLNWSYRLNQPQPQPQPTATPTGNGSGDGIAAVAVAGDVPARMVDDNRAPTNPVELFAWICAQNFPQLEDELPPPGFDEVSAMEDTDTDSDCDIDSDFRCKCCDRLLFSLDASLEQRSIGTQTAMAAVAAAAAAARQLRAQLLAEHIRDQVDGQTQTEEGGNIQEQQQAQDPDPIESPLLAAIRRSLSVQVRGRSVWGMLKALLVIVSLLHGCYWMGDCICRLPMLRDLMDRAQFICTPAPPPPPRSLPTFIWGQLCRLARKLHIV
ncbi:uncharacterized protein LOC122757713 [Drosophila mojavensis]|uniref:uncharacterized protein LOC122757713 n=1 Tax=Drosophila mojavensis TaxID=7230 RepID=UPI00017CAB1D|nr:uncharacterized protein LOC122757713 [Drosophila mojavensis]